MARCDVCGERENMPYQCRHCGGTFCADHRLPENHDCPGLDNWGDPGKVFESKFDRSMSGSTGRSRSTTERIVSALGIDTGPGSVFGYFRGNMSFVFLGIMWIFFLAEMIVVYVLQDYFLFQALFVLAPGQIEFVWTWVTSIFSHSPVGLFHIAGNSIVLYFFGPVLERQIGSKKFATLFLVTGVAAGLGQVLTSMALGTGSAGVLGASGAIMGILGVLTVLNPNLKVYLWFILPIPLWILTFGYAGLDLFGFLSQGNVMGNVAHAAHLSGLIIGLAYGQHVKDKIRSPSQVRLGGMGRGPGGPGRGRGPF